MISVIKIASYFCLRFIQDFGNKIDEMKLHKLLYFTQRECLVLNESPIFDEIFEARKYGPMVPIIRRYFKENRLTENISEEELAPYIRAINKVYECYACQNSWTLSSITHGEYAWQEAYKKASDEVEIPAMISTNDMLKDASRVRLRRFLKTCSTSSNSF